MIMAALPRFQADPVFPQRDLLLDPAFVAERVAPQIGFESSSQMEQCERLRVTYRAGESLRVLYKLEGKGQSHMVAARALPASTKAKKDAAPASGKSAPAFRDDENNTLYWVFPHDRKIANLPKLMSVPPVLSEMLSSRWHHSRLMAYAPEKCATVQCLDEERNVLAYAKCYAGHEGFEAYRTYNEFADDQNTSRQFAVPRVIAYSSSLHLLVLEPILGKRIADLRGEELEHGLNRLGRALAFFHQVPVTTNLPKFTRLEPDYLQEACAIISTVRPDVANIAQKLCSALCSNPQSKNAAHVRVHGDVHPKNGILRNDQVVMIDLDQAGTAPAAADLGSLMAALRYEVVIGTLTNTEEERLVNAFLSGYTSAGSLPTQAELHWHTAAALLAERALRAISRVRLEGLENLQELLMEATNVLEEARA